MVNVFLDYQLIAKRIHMTMGWEYVFAIKVIIIKMVNAFLEPFALRIVSKIKMETAFVQQDLQIIQEFVPDAPQVPFGTKIQKIVQLYVGLIQFIQLHLKAVFALMDLACLMEIVLVAHKIIMQQKDIV